LKIPSDKELGIVPRGKYLTEWRKKTFWEQHSNLTAAEHAWIKVQMLGWEKVTDEMSPRSPRTTSADFGQIEDSQKILMAKVEHNRWMAERLLLGWSFGQRHEQPPLRTSLVPSEKLDHNELKKDFQQINTVIRYFLDRRLKKIDDKAPKQSP
jgi:hypothetical protein